MADTRTVTRLPIEHEEEMVAQARRIGLRMPEMLARMWLATRDYFTSLPNIPVIDMEAVYKNEPKRK